MLCGRMSGIAIRLGNLEKDLYLSSQKRNKVNFVSRRVIVTIVTRLFSKYPKLHWRYLVSP